MGADEPKVVVVEHGDGPGPARLLDLLRDGGEVDGCGHAGVRASSSVEGSWGT
jgi:hypothetical protein